MTDYVNIFKYGGNPFTFRTKHDSHVYQFVFISLLKAMVEDKEAVSTYILIDHANLIRIPCI